MLTLICGIPNAGKTTFSQQYNNVIHLDDIMQVSIICKMIENESDVCVEGVFMDAHRRKKIVEAYKGKKICIWLNTSKEVCIARENRQRHIGLIRYSAQAFEPPTLGEGWDEIIIINENNEIQYIKKE